MLWGKMLRFLNLGLYDEALTCADAYGEKVRDQDENAALYMPAIRRFINQIGSTGIDYGLMVVGFESGQTSHEQYELGDVIIAVNTTPVHNYEEYSQAKEALAQGEDYQVVVLRENEQLKLQVPGDAPRVQIREMTEK